MNLDIISNISKIGSEAWNNLNINDHPFTNYDFLYALEESKSVCAETGWLPQHIILKDIDNKIIGILPNYLKSHSYGEYVFDHSWANAYQKAGGSYYPKLISAIPFTPVKGPRFLYKESKKEIIIKNISQFMMDLANKNNLSSAHINFLDENTDHILEKKGWLKRVGLQFHWKNKGYSSFEDFLEELKSSKRKMIKKERDYIKKTGIVINRISGNDLKSTIWDQFYKFYLDTIDKKWGSAYLTRDFFSSISDKLNKKIVLIIAEKDNQIVAGALNFTDKNCLYGRNWGSKIDVPFLHFEMCYYQAIDYAIDQKLKVVEAGAQGHHKIKRGYLAKPTFSYHYLPNSSFRNAVSTFINDEKRHIQENIDYVNNHDNPFKFKIKIKS